MADTPGSAHEFDLDDLAGTPALEHALFGGDDAPPELDLQGGADVPAEDLPRKLGIPLRRPSRAERKRQEDRATGGVATDDDPFATLLAPLDDDELDQLRSELESDEVLFVRHQRARLAGQRVYRLSALVAIAVALLLAATGFWVRYIDTVNAQTPPTWISDWAGEWASGIWMVAAVYGALMWLILVGAAARSLGRVLIRPTLVGAVVVIAELVLVLMTMALLLSYEVAGLLGLATVGVIAAALAARWAFRSMTRGRRR